MLGHVSRLHSRAGGATAVAGPPSPAARFPRSRDCFAAHTAILRLQPLPALAGCRVPLAPPGLRSSVQPPASRSIRCGVCVRARAASAWRRQKTEAHPRLRSPLLWVAGAGATHQSGATRHQQNLAPAGRRLSVRPPVRQSVPASVRSSLRPPHTATPPASAIAAGNARRWCSAEIVPRPTSPARTAPHPAPPSCSGRASLHTTATPPGPPPVGRVKCCPRSGLCSFVVPPRFRACAAGSLDPPALRRQTVGMFRLSPKQVTDSFGGNL